MSQRSQASQSCFSPVLSGVSKCLQISSQSRSLKVGRYTAEAEADADAGSVWSCADADAEADAGSVWSRADVDADVDADAAIGSASSSSERVTPHTDEHRC